jgi:hypothetical protein
MNFWTAVVIALLILVPVLWFMGGFLFKILWLFWPAIASIAIGGLVFWRSGMDGFLALPVSMVLAIVLCWLWQRTRLFLRVDHRIGRAFFFD